MSFVRRQIQLGPTTNSSSAIRILKIFSGRWWPSCIYSLMNLIWSLISMDFFTRREKLSDLLEWMTTPPNRKPLQLEQIIKLFVDRGMLEKSHEIENRMLRWYTHVFIFFETFYTERNLLFYRVAFPIFPTQAQCFAIIYRYEKLFLPANLCRQKNALVSIDYRLIY